MLSQAYERAEAIRKTIEGMEFAIPESLSPIRATMSFGVAHRENFSQTPDEIVHGADLALYHSKLSGRNRSFAYADNDYIDLSAKINKTSNKSVLKTPKKAEQEAIESPQPSPVEVDLMGSDSASRQSRSMVTEDQTARRKSKGPRHAASIFIGALAMISFLAFGTLLFRFPMKDPAQSIDWFCLIAISLLIVLSEIYSIDLYVRQTSVSTSAIPILVAYLIFGPVGVAWASLVLAVSLVIKFRSRFSRFVFNFSNHLLAGTIILGLVLLSGGDFLSLPNPYQILLSLLSAGVLFLTSTWMVSFGIGMDLKQSASQIWKEQFSWLVPYYIGIGVIAFALIFGYKHDHITGMLLMVVPMLLLRMSQKQYVDRTREVVTELREKNQALKKNSEEILELNEGLLITLSEIIELRDPYVLGHSMQVSKYATEIARLLGLNEKQIDLIRKAGLLHDIGKLGIPMEILTKPGRLTREEYEIVKKHAALGADLVKDSPSLRPIASIIRHHHEFYDGSGYPDGLAGNKISIEARVIAVADAIEAMTSDRPYRKAHKLEDVIDELNKCSGSQFDPLVLPAALMLLEEAIESRAIQQARQDIGKLSSRQMVKMQTV